MKPTPYIFLGILFALFLISYVAANDTFEDEIKNDGANQVADQKYYSTNGYGGGGYGGGYGGGGYGGGWGGNGGGWGGNGGGWGGGCRWGCCGGYSGGWGGGGRCRCCYNAQEALAYMQNQVRA